jgi:P27 family predicted phage terminase small subunit
MPQRLKSADEIRLTGNARKLTRAELERRSQNIPGDSETVRSGRPKTPKTLTPMQLECWKEAAKILKQRGTLSKGDGESLRLWSVVKARWLQANAEVEKDGLTIQETRCSKSGDEYTVTVNHPCLKIAENCERLLTGLAVKLGLTPLGREKVRRTSAPKEEKYTPIEGTLGADMAHLFDAKGRPKQTC